MGLLLQDHGVGGYTWVFDLVIMVLTLTDNFGENEVCRLRVETKIYYGVEILISNEHS